MVRSASTFALVFLFLSCARPMLGAPAEPVYTESYPAVAWQEVGKTEADSLDRLWYGEPRPKFTVEDLRNSSVRMGKWVQTMHWVQRAAHPLLDSLLPGTQFYHVGDKDLSTAPPMHYTLALRDGKFYRLDRLNYLLRDAGFKFDTTEMADITKVAVLWTLLEKYPRNDSVSAATAFPAVKFGEVKGGDVHCDVGGEEHLYGVSFWGRTPALLYDNGRQIQEFRIPSELPEPTQPPPSP